MMVIFNLTFNFHVLIIMENLEITNKQKRRNYGSEHVAVYSSLYLCPTI